MCLDVKKLSLLYVSTFW